jgi:hypothetical protein
MPPRYAYWTILVDEQPTAFRAAVVEDLMPTFKRLKAKSPSARMVWFQNGKIWNSRLEAQDAMRERGLRGREGDKRQGGFRDRARSPLREPPPEPRDSSGKLEWQPKSASGSRRSTPVKPRGDKPAWRAKPATGERRPSGKLEWQPKSSAPATSAPREKRKWVPKEEYKKAQGIEARRDKNWRPGGEHKDPRQKYKDAKKAKWTRFKQTVRKRWESKTGGKKKGS